MFYELVATVALGVGCAGMMMLLRKITGNRIPRAATPIAAGLGILFFAMWSEQSWYPRTAEKLPESVKIIRTTETTGFWKPWTYFVPQVNQMMVVDTAAFKRNPKVPEQVMMDLTFMGRWKASMQVPHVVDCSLNRQTNFVEGITFDDRGAVDRAPWFPLPADDPLYEAACKN